MALCVSVAIDDVIVKIDKLYDYCVPNQFADCIAPGIRVAVPFSNGNIRKKALVLSAFERTDTSGLKEIIGVADKDPVINGVQLELLKLLKTRYFVTYFKAFKAIVPRGVDFKINERYTAEKSLKDKDLSLYNFIKSKRSGVRLEQVPSEHIKQFKKFLSDGDIKSELSVNVKGEKTEKFLKLAIDRYDLEKRISELSKRFERQRDLMSLFLDYDEISYRDAVYYSGCSSQTIRSLENKGIIKTSGKILVRSPYKDIERRIDDSIIKLSEEQQLVYDGIAASIDKYSTHLLHGVTGSGKTLIYIALIDRVLKSGKSVIFMLPEISLTPQTLARFYTRYGDGVSVVHSGLAPGERADEWRKIKSGKSNVIVGTRSAVFSPVSNLGLVIIDEEHEASYKSESSPRYHARDISKFICKKFGIPLVIGSATPSIESFYYAKKGVYSYHNLSKRFNNNPLPEVGIIDMCDAFKQGQQSFLSEDLRLAIEENLNNSEQTILFLNRRGANSVMGCRSCGYIEKCPNCKISLTFHLANSRCMCHYCGYSVKAFTVCPECGSKHIKKLGVGTQLVHSELQNIFPDASILRMDFDTVGSYLEYGQKLTAFKNGEYNIMLGTQMVAKGLDFPDVTLVGVINADLSLFVDDFRAGERTFSLLTQVCGRSGRAGKEGRALIQTHSPDNASIQYAKEQDYEKYYDYEIRFRQALNYPPFCDIVRFTVSSKDDKTAHSDIMSLYNLLDKLSKTAFNDIPLRLLYPTTPKIAKFNEKFRYTLVMKSKQGKRLYELLDKVHLYFLENRSSELAINVNPMSNV